MSAAESTHSPTPEEVMAYLDGEETPMPRAQMEAHLAGCERCQSVAEDLRGVSAQAKAWIVENAPALESPSVTRGHGRLVSWTAWPRRFPNRVAMAGIALAAAVVLIVAVTQRPQFESSPPSVATLTVPYPPTAMETRAARRQSGVAGGVAGGMVGGLPEPPPAPRALAEQGQSGNSATAPRGPMVVRTATLRIVVKQFDVVRGTVEGVVAQAGGFLDRLTVDGNSATARSLSGTLRVPSDRLAGVLDRLRGLGEVVEDTQGAEDVTDQVIDLDARLASARATEQRLTELLRTRTGKLSDVLDVERELARVRLDIERLDGEKANVSKRVTYATVQIVISEERKAGLDGGPLSLATRIRVAAADGAAGALETVVALLLLILRAGPSLLLWGTAAAAAWLVLRRRFGLGTPK